MTHVQKICTILNTLEEGNRYIVEHGLMFDIYNNNKCIDSPYIYLMEEVYDFLEAGGQLND